MQARAFGLGVVVGAVASAIAGWIVLDGDARPPATAPKSVAAEAVSGELVEEVARLRAELAAARTPRTAVIDAAVRPSEPAVDAPTEASATANGSVRAVDALLGELDALEASGVLRARVESSPQELAYFVVRAWVEAGQPERALLALQRLEPLQLGSEMASWVAGYLQQRGDRAGATTAMLLAIRGNPLDWDVVGSLADLDPAAALATRAAAEVAPEAAQQFEAQTAVLLLAAGRRDEALQHIDALVASGAAVPQLWERLVASDPAAAEERLRVALQHEADDDHSLRLDLADALRRQGRTPEALAELRRLLDANPRDEHVLAALGGMDRNLALDHLQQQCAMQPDAECWRMYGDQLQQAGRVGDAIAAFGQAMELSPDGGYEQRLLAIAPEQTAPDLLRRAASSRNDELYGDVGDALWAVGRHADALDCWERARAIDPDDGEWIAKLAAVAAGRDPLQ